MALKMIAAMTVDGVIGKDGDLPWSYPKDLKRFQVLTSGHTVIMGRKTWESIPEKFRPLKGRKNIVLTSNPGLIMSQKGTKDVLVFKSLLDALTACPFEEEDVWLIGGASVYAEGMQYASFIDATFVPDIVATGELVRFPPIKPDLWEPYGPVGHEYDDRLYVMQYRKRGL